MDSNDERKNVGLCYQALGLEFGAPPEDVDKAYQRMLEEINKKKSSSDPEKAKEAAADLELANDLYDKIKNSITYRTSMRDQEHQRSIREQMKKDKQGAQQQQQFKICPFCTRNIVVTLKKCPYCRNEILTPFEKVMKQLLSGKALAVMAVLLLLAVAVAVVSIVKPDLFKRNVAPEIEPIPATTQPAPQPGAEPQPAAPFGNASGATQKP